MTKRRASSQEIATLLAILVQERDFCTEANLITRLVEQGYPLSSGIETHIEQLFVSLNHENDLLHSARDLILALTRTGYIGTSLYQKHVAEITQSVITTTPRADQELISILIQHDFPRRSWMIDLLLLFEEYRTELLHVITYVYPTPTGQLIFFLQDGPRYLTNGAPSLPREYWVQPMVSLYQQLLSFNGKVERLFVLLDSISDPEEILRLLTNTPLEGYEAEYFLQRYGQRYLQNFQLAPKLANMVIANFARLINSGYPNGPDLLFTIMPLQTGEIYLDRLLSLVKLTPEQQISFLERYGANYLKLYPSMPPLMEYVSTYITHFHIDALEKDVTKAFFAFLAQQYKYLALDPITQSHIKCWKIIDGYFTSPDAQVPALAGLAEALPFLGLPNNRQFTEKLAQAFVSCIETNQDLSTIIESMRQVPKVAKEKAEEYQFLYMLADQAAKTYKQQPSLDIVFPYLLFVLTISEQDRSHTEHFTQIFLDRLLCFIAANDSIMWKRLDTFVAQQKLQHTEVERWHNYLKMTSYVPEKMYHIFVCYARKDKEQLEELEKHLSLLRKQNIIDVWYDRDISAGTDWEKEIAIHLNKADIILLLVSPDFMNSDYCYSVEMMRAMERHEQKKARVIPIILRPVYWKGAPFGEIQALPRDAKPMIGSYWRYVDEAFYDVAEGIRQAVEELKKADRTARKS